MCFHEKKWLEKFPDDFRPVFYERYIDDTFILFKDQSHAPRNKNINFTMESEQKRELHFLDTFVRRMPSILSTSVYRNPTFSG